ncbi:MAG: chordopoxvirus fusion protein, partial [Thermodesulfovibrionales bacterium]
AEAQKRTEQRVEELAEAQKRTEQRVEELAEAQKASENRLTRLETVVEELAEAQKRTEEELTTLTGIVKSLQKEVGGLSNTVGYELEDSLYPLLPIILKEDFGVEIKGELERIFLEYDGREDEVNIYGEGLIDSKKVYIIGESKAQIGKGDVEVFAKMVKRLNKYLKAQTLPILVCYTVHPKVETYIKEHHPDIKLYKTFQIKRRARLYFK